jgi:serine/threonine protein phosphatase PrpC
VRQITFDHRQHEFLWRDGCINDEEYGKRCGEGDHRVAQAIGYGSSRSVFHGNRRDPRIRIDVEGGWSVRHPDAFRLTLAQNEKLLLATDGLCIRPDEIAPVIETYGVSQECANALVRAAFEAGSDDNITVLVTG